MAKKTINLGVVPDGVGGDTYRTAMQKAIDNFDELYETGAIEVGTNSHGRFSKFKDGTLFMQLSSKTSRMVSANEIAVISFPTPASMIHNSDNALVAFRIIPSNTNDHFGVISSYPDSEFGVTAIIRNGPVAQTFGVKCTIMTRWKE